MLGSPHSKFTNILCYVCNPSRLQYCVHLGIVWCLNLPLNIGFCFKPLHVHNGHTVVVSCTLYISMWNPSLKGFKCLLHILTDTADKFWNLFLLYLYLVHSSIFLPLIYSVGENKMKFKCSTKNKMLINSITTVFLISFLASNSVMTSSTT